MIRVQSEDFDVGQELKNLSADKLSIGGLCSFVGLVREIHPDKTDQSMTLEHYPGMTERMLAEIEAEAHERWDLEASLIIHRFGKLLPGDQIVFVATASRHREATFAASSFIMDWLKTKASFWKLEASAGKGEWVDARETDELAQNKWKTDLV